MVRTALNYKLKKKKADPQVLEESWIGQELNASAEKLREVQGTTPLLPREGGSFVDHYSDRPHRHLRLQRRLTKRVEEAAGRQWHEDYPSTERERQRRQLMEQPGAKDVFTVIPEDATWSLPSEEQLGGQRLQGGSACHTGSWW